MYTHFMYGLCTIIGGNSYIMLISDLSHWEEYLVTTKHNEKDGMGVAKD